MSSFLQWIIDTAIYGIGFIAVMLIFAGCGWAVSTYLNKTKHMWLCIMYIVTKKPGRFKSAAHRRQTIDRAYEIALLELEKDTKK